jgi:hypothetical protein
MPLRFCVLQGITATLLAKPHTNPNPTQATILASLG